MATGKYKNLNNEEYWKQRSLEKENEYFQLAENLNAELKKAYSSNLKAIQKEVAYFYSKYAADGVLNYSDAVKFNRLNSLMKDIKAIIFKMVGEEQVSVEDLLSNICKENYYETIFDIQKGIGLSFNFAKINEKVIKTIITNPWSGEAYSKRIWKNRDKLVKNIRKTLTDGFIKGQSNQKMAENLSETMNSGRKVAQRLVRTETTYVANKSTMEGYKECDIDKYRFLATLDSRTSSLCRSLDGKPFDVKDAKAGVNLPSMHGNCRSTTTPEFGQDYAQRIARDKKGKNIFVKGDMSFDEWKKEYGIK
jgi:SPP1 gp7 family putative phage head morphogenesis protein